MAYIPANAKWYLADIVEQIVVEDDPRYVVHTNTVLIRADSPEDAYAKAVELGTNKAVSYQNPEGKSVTITYRGLWDLKVIHSELEHGAELAYSEDIETDQAAIEQYVSTKEELGVFASRQPSQGPNYFSGDVLEKLHEQFPELTWSDIADTPA
jgi:hypothetical protein